MEQKIAVITGADGGMGTEITRAVAIAGYHVIMVCYTKEKGEKVRQELVYQTGNPYLTVMQCDFSSLASVAALADRIRDKNIPISLLMNNAGVLETGLRMTEDGLERTVGINYVAPYLFTRKLLPAMKRGARIVNMVSCTYAIGQLDFPLFFEQGRKGNFWRIPVYGNTKLALMLFTIELAKRTKVAGIAVNAADPGVVSTPIITMHAWFDPLTDVLFRPFIRKPKQGAATAIELLLEEKNEGKTGTLNVSCKTKKLSKKYTQHRQMEELWEETERIVSPWL